MNFLDKSVDNRISEVLISKNIDLLHELISKHLNITIGESLMRYNLDPNFIKNTLIITSERSDWMYELFIDMQRFISPSEFDFITSNKLGLNISLFISKII